MYINNVSLLCNKMYYVVDKLINESPLVSLFAIEIKYCKKVLSNDL